MFRRTTNADAASLTGAPSCVLILFALNSPFGQVGESKLYDDPVFPLELARQPHTDHALGRIARVIKLKIKDRLEVTDTAKMCGPQKGARAQD